MKIAVVGATGMVGSEMLEVLAEQNFAYSELLLVASENSIGKKITHQGKEYEVIGMEQAVAAAEHLVVMVAAERAESEVPFVTDCAGVYSCAVRGLRFATGECRP